MTKYLCDICAFFKRRVYLISWISLVIYLFYKSFTFYLNGRQFFYLRRILGLGLCISRGTATVLNLCCALVLLPICKKLNQLLYRVLSKVCPRLFFLWLESAKSFHMTVAVTLVIFGVIHSISHFVNLWNFSRSYDEEREEINLARYKNESPFSLLMSVAGVTGVSMLLIVVSMGLTSTRFIRRRVYNAFWYTHQLYLPFIVLLVIHPLSGVLKEEVLDENKSLILNTNEWTNSSASDSPKFAAIQSMTWLWMAVPLTCFITDLLWRIFTRNLAKVRILNVKHMAGRTISLSLSTPHKFVCRKGQYILMQCLDVSMIEWHPFTVVEIPTQNQRKFTIWIKVNGDWTESLEQMIKETGPDNLSIFIDGPFSSPMEGICRSEISICVAAGVGITPFVSILTDMLINPRSKSPGRVHLMWIVRHETELTWAAKLATDTILQLRYHNRLDRLQIELYVTSTANYFGKPEKTHTVLLNKNGNLTHVFNDEKKCLLTSKNNREITQNHLNNTELNENYNKFKRNEEQTNLVLGGKESSTDIVSDDRKCLLTPKNKRDHVNCNIKVVCDGVNKDNLSDTSDSLDATGIREKYINSKMDIGDINNDCEFEIVKKYPLIGCRVRRGRPHWDRVFGYWAHLYPGHHLNLYCCGPKKLVKLLRNKCKYSSKFTKTKFTFIHDAFS